MTSALQCAIYQKRRVTARANISKSSEEEFPVKFAITVAVLTIRLSRVCYAFQTLLKLACGPVAS